MHAHARIHLDGSGGGGSPQVNTDVLSWLLRPVTFITGLPAPSSSPAWPAFSGTATSNGRGKCDALFPCDPSNDETRGHFAAEEVAGPSDNMIRDGDCGGGDDVDGGGCGAQEAHEACHAFDGINGYGQTGKEKGSARDSVNVDSGLANGEEQITRGARGAMATITDLEEERVGLGAEAQERRAAPVPPIDDSPGESGGKIGGGAGNDGQEKHFSKKEGFHSYDETHQVLHFVGDGSNIVSISTNRCFAYGVYWTGGA